MALAPAHTGKFTRADLEAHLGRILASPAFASSQRCREFLNYITNKTIDNEIASLSERLIAQDLFGLPHYDPAADSSVRVKAGDVRKRLVKYYANPAPEDFIMIDLPVGSYATTFSPLPVAQNVVAPPIEIPGVPKAGDFPWKWVAIGCALMLAVALGVMLLRSPKDTADTTSLVYRFWQPLLAGDRPILISLPSPSSFLPRGQTLADFKSGKLQPVETLAPHVTRYVIPNAEFTRQNIFFGVGEAQALVKMAVALDHMKKPFVMKAAIDVSSSDLHNQNAVLLGGFSSRWTLKVVEDLPYRLEYRTDRPRVVEVNGQHRTWESTGWAPGGRDGVDYAIAARLKDWSTGQAIMILAGPQTFGSQAAAEFVIDPVQVAEIGRNAQLDWLSKNIAIVVETKVIEGVPSAGRIVARSFW